MDDPILDHRGRYRGRATFFVLGNAMEGDDRRRTLRRIVAEGHELGNHTSSHPGDLASLSDDRIRDELERTTALIEEIAGVPPLHWRTLFLRSTPRLLRLAGSLGPRHVDCSIMPGDWAISGEETFSRTCASLRNGAVVVLHGGRPWDEPVHLSPPTRAETVWAVELLLEYMSEHGMRCVTIAELVAAEPTNSSLGPTPA